MEKECFRIIGKRMPRLDALEKVTGKAKYCADLKLSHLLHAKILRSPYAHAKILNINTNKAKELSGVKAVITFQDVPQTKYNLYKLYEDPRCADKTILTEKARFIGDEIAAVAAVSEYIAQDALELIEVEYEELPAVFDPKEAMKAEAPVIHEGVKNNVSLHCGYSHGEEKKWFSEAELVFEDRFQTQQVEHCIEPQATIASWDLVTKKLTVYASSQMPFLLKEDLADVLGIEERQIRIINSVIGSGFGKKMEMHALIPICALLSLKTGRPVKMVHTKEEEFIGTRTRHPAIMETKTGVKRDGTIITRSLKVIGDNGAYNSQSWGVFYALAPMYGAMYSRVPHLKFEGDIVYTNKPYGGAMRGWGNPQGSFAREVQMDIIAEGLGIDPMELRLKNANKPGDITCSGYKFTSCGLEECIIKAAEAIGWKKKRGKMGPYKGVGMACAMHVGGGAARFVRNVEGTGAFVKIEDDGTIVLIIGAAEIGGGQATLEATIVAEVLGVRLEDVRVINNDSDVCPWDLGTHGSRSTFCAGNAARVAAEDARRQLFKIVSEKLEAPLEALDVGDRKVFVKERPEKFVTIADAAKAAHYRVGSNLILGRGWYDSPNEHWNTIDGTGNCSAAYTLMCHAVELEVDPRTGKVNLVKFVAAQDVGKALNPLGVEGQMEGGVAMGIGYALEEGYIYDQNTGELLNRSLVDYRIPVATEMPILKTIIVESIDPEGPFGGKGIGEGVTNPVAPAIANALYDATKIRFKELPITPEKVLWALKKKVETDLMI